MSSTNGNGNGSAPNSSHTVLKPREEWIVKRKAEAARTGDDNVSQMHFARKGLVTEEMLYVAERERVCPRAHPRRSRRRTHDHPGQHQPP